MSKLLDKLRVYLKLSTEIDQLSSKLQDMQEQHHTLEQEIDRMVAEEDNP